MKDKGLQTKFLRHAGVYRKRRTSQLSSIDSAMCCDVFFFALHFPVFDMEIIEPFEVRFSLLHHFSELKEENRGPFRVTREEIWKCP